MPAAGEHARAADPSGRVKRRLGALLPGPIGRRGLLAAGLALPALAAAPAPLRIGGTGMALGIAQALLGALAEQPAAPLAVPTVFPSLGTGGGLAALRGGRLDIALASRGLLPAEAATGLAAQTFARTPVGFATREDTRALALTEQDAARMVAGEAMSWPGGGQVRVVRRDRSESDWIMLAGLSPRLAEAVERVRRRPGLATAGSDQDNADLLETLPGSLGLISLGQVLTERRRLRMLALDGQAPTVEAMIAGRYPLAATLHVVTWAEPSPPVRQFLDFIQGPLALSVLQRHGYARPPGTAA